MGDRNLGRKYISEDSIDAFYTNEFFSFAIPRVFTSLVNHSLIKDMITNSLEGNLLTEALLIECIQNMSTNNTFFLSTYKYSNNTREICDFVWYDAITTEISCADDSYLTKRRKNRQNNILKIRGSFFGYYTENHESRFWYGHWLIPRKFEFTKGLGRDILFCALYGRHPLNNELLTTKGCYKVTNEIVQLLVNNYVSPFVEIDKVISTINSLFDSTEGVKFDVDPKYFDLPKIFNNSGSKKFNYLVRDNATSSSILKNTEGTDVDVFFNSSLMPVFFLIPWDNIATRICDFYDMYFNMNITNCNYTGDMSISMANFVDFSTPMAKKDAFIYGTEGSQFPKPKTVGMSNQSFHDLFAGIKYPAKRVPNSDFLLSLTDLISGNFLNYPRYESIQVTTDRYAKRGKIVVNNANENIFLYNSVCVGLPMICGLLHETPLTDEQLKSFREYNLQDRYIPLYAITSKVDMMVNTLLALIDEVYDLVTAIDALFK